MEEKHKVLSRKLEMLIRKKNLKSEEITLDKTINSGALHKSLGDEERTDGELPNNQNIVRNLSSEILSDDQLCLLKKGLNFSLPYKKNPKNDLIIDIETGLRNKSVGFSEKQAVRCSVEKVLKDKLSSYELNQQTKHHYEILDELREKDVFIMKADKGNAVVVIDKSDYKERMESHIANGP